MFCAKCGTKNAERAKFCSKCGAKLGEAATPTPAPTPTQGATKPESESSTGMSANVAGLLCYVGAWVTGIVFVVLEKKSTFVKFHAWQSIITFGALTVIQIILSIIGVATFSFFLSPGWWVAHVLGIIVWVISGILWIVLMLLAYQGKMWKVPGAGNWAEKQANK